MRDDQKTTSSFEKTKFLFEVASLLLLVAITIAGFALMAQ